MSAFPLYAICALYVCWCVAMLAIYCRAPKLKFDFPAPADDTPQHHAGKPSQPTAAIGENVATQQTGAGKLSRGLLARREESNRLSSFQLFNRQPSTDL